MRFPAERLLRTGEPGRQAGCSASTPRAGRGCTAALGWVPYSPTAQPRVPAAAGSPDRAGGGTPAAPHLSHSWGTSRQQSHFQTALSFSDSRKAGCRAEKMGQHLNSRPFHCDTPISQPPREGVTHGKGPRVPPPGLPSQNAASTCPHVPALYTTGNYFSPSPNTGRGQSPGQAVRSPRLSDGTLSSSSTVSLLKSTAPDATL